MSYFAELDATGVVLRVIVADAATIKRYPGEWVETFMDTPGKRYAGIGYRYRSDWGDFIPARPGLSWVLDEAARKWVDTDPQPKVMF